MHVRTTLVALAAVAVLAGCAASAAEAPQPPDVAAPSPTSEPTSPGPITGSWAPGTPAAELGDGVTVTHCEGDAPLLCVADGDTHLGLLEHMTYDAPAELVDRTGAELDAVLRDFAAQQLVDTRADRVAGCGPDHEVGGTEPVTTEVGGQQGLRWDVTTTRGDSIVEQVVLWATVRGDRLDLVVATAAMADGCMASEFQFFAPAILDQLVPALDRYVAGTPLPA